MLILFFLLLGVFCLLVWGFCLFVCLLCNKVKYGGMCRSTSSLCTVSKPTINNNVCISRQDRLLKGLKQFVYLFFKKFKYTCNRIA